jgi:hypothetical protein
VTTKRFGRERHVWIAVTAVLLAALSWLAVAGLALAAGACAGSCAGAAAVLRALAHAALAVGRLGGPVAAVALALAAILAVAVRLGGHAAGRTRHV